MGWAKTLLPYCIDFTKCLPNTSPTLSITSKLTQRWQKLMKFLGWGHALTSMQTILNLIRLLYWTCMTNLRHNFCHVCSVFEVHVQLLIAIPVPNREASSNSMIPRLGRSLTEQSFLFHDFPPSAAFSAMHLLKNSC